ncbi:hypothetical protein M514_11306, partial [Trichuris suis]
MEIRTYGTRLMFVDLDLGRVFKWPSIVAEVPKLMTGAGFLGKFHLLPDLKNRRLVDSVTLLTSKGTLKNQTANGLRTANGSSPYHCILVEFPEITKPLTATTKPKHNVVHCIIINGNSAVTRV